MEQNGNQNCPSTMLCKSGCGFYGSTSFDGMCSKCYKEAVKRKNNSTTPEESATGRPTPPTVSGPGLSECVGLTTPCVETASPTVHTTTTAQERDEDTCLGAEAKADDKCDGAADTSSVDGSDKDKKPKKNRCFHCKKKVGLTGFECRCGGLYCSSHRYSDKHNCQFDYQKHGAEEIRKNNPVVVSEKIQKI